MSEIVKLLNVTKEYGNNGVTVRALDQVDISVSPGEFTVVAGPSGSGKSTLLNLIGGLDRPTSGSVQVTGSETSALSRGQLSRRRLHNIGFVFQAYNLIPVLTAYENAEYVMMLQGTPAEKRRQQVTELLNLVGLHGMENRFPRELSGGQQQRVAIARAIAPQPQLILADEPTANLDSTTSAALLDLMEKLNREKGVTFLFSTHDLRDGHISSDDTRDIA